ncbi:hypothetical protein FI667_g1870, partial [Globisporangium splendens]
MERTASRIACGSGSRTRTLQLSLGNSIVRSAVYTDGDTTNVLEFAYTVAAGDRAARLDYMNQDSLKCSLLQKSAVPTLAASTTLPLPGSEGSLGLESRIRVDPSAPRITSVSSPLLNGVYGAGQVIDISITFSEPVRFSAVNSVAPRLHLAIANKDLTARLGAAYATYTMGAGTSTLLFRFVTKEGDMALPLAYDGVDALSIYPRTGGYIYAVANRFRRVSLRLPVPLATGSLSNDHDIRIDTMEPPRVIGVGSATPDGVYTAGDTLMITVRFSMPVVVTGAPTLQLERGNPLIPGIATSVSGSGSTDLVFQYAIQVGDRADRLEYRASPETERRPPRRREWDKLVICSARANALRIDATSSIKRLATTPTTSAVLDLPEVSSWPKLRFHTSRDEFLYVNQVEATTDIPESERTIRPMLHNEFTIAHQKKSILMYEGGTPIATEYYPGAEPWSPEDPFRETFGRMSSEGTWTLAIRDTQVKQEVDTDHVTHGNGGISDWVLSIANEAGRTKVYHMDIKAHVHTVPRHGNLYVAIQNTETDDHLDRDGDGILDASEADAYLSRFLLSYDVFPEYTRKRTLLNFLKGYDQFGGIPVLTDASERQKQLPVACDATCLHGIGIWDPYFYPGTAGDVGIKLLEIGNDRVVEYVPNAEFRGKDTITFTISIGMRESLVLGTIEIHVRDCEDPVCSTE